MSAIQEDNISSPTGAMVGQVQHIPIHPLPPYYYAFVIRLKPFYKNDNQRFGMEQIIEEFLEPISTTWLLSEELVPKLHYHIYIEASKIDLNGMKELVRKFMYPYFPDRTRGFGSEMNTQYSSDREKAISYPLKYNGRITYSGFTEEFIAYRKTQAFVKTETQLENELSQLYDEFVSKNMDPYIYHTKIAIIYADAGRNVNHKTIQNYVNSKLIKRNPKEDYVLSLVKKSVLY